MSLRRWEVVVQERNLADPTKVDAIIDKSGSTVSTEIHGYIDCSVKLTGMPDLTMSFVNPRLFDDVSFHPCVRWVALLLKNLCENKSFFSDTRNGRVIEFSPLYPLMATLGWCLII